MSEELAGVDRDLRQAIAELELVSHASTQNFDPSPRDTSEEPGGRRPGQPDGEYEPPWRDVAEHSAWEEAYQRKTVAHFREERQGILTKFEADPGFVSDAISRLIGLRHDCRACVEAWRKRPINLGDTPQSMHDFGWKQYIAISKRDAGELAREYGCTRRYINKIKAMDWAKGLRAATETDERDRAVKEWREKSNLPTLVEVEGARREASDERHEEWLAKRARERAA